MTIKSLILGALIATSISCNAQIEKTGNGVKKQDKSKLPVKVVGSFRSIKGVMNSLSCYCYNGGNLTTADNQEIKICFENEDIDVNCEKVEIIGEYRTITKSSGAKDPCPSGQSKILFVKSYKCL